MQHIGIIGVGEIGGAVVDGLSDGVEDPPRVHLSPRGARAAAELSGRYANVEVCAGNQEVVDRSDLVILAVRRPDVHDALAGLRVDDGTVVVSVVAGVAVADLRAILGTGAPVVRAIPLPPVRERRCVTVTYPSHPVVDAFFGRLGEALPAADEAAFNVMSALTGTLTTHYAFLGTLATWAAGHGIAPDEAERYVRGLFQAAGRSLGDETRSLQRLAADHETPNGLNERVRTTWFDPGNAEALTKVLDAVLGDLG
ncbi:Pyrroline-5-carboxylate reductase [Nonomuraea coxensis DSM 45129]|uniref:Pyrroline-5-carboxylate reductase n=1 Tax=Nonomuraea coxensis DSM 45129 TaxID=1122611 RepID=A0ABX8U2R5_9ACTN|nr:pyrroline-5-carboxylate reductase [Nonomuraea coxensis]QYC41959.1 Pyrroline-5-carboxylate reductase [Nonomuraea coxensis DSM 45129]